MTNDKSLGFYMPKPGTQLNTKRVENFYHQKENYGKKFLAQNHLNLDKLKKYIYIYFFKLTV